MVKNQIIWAPAIDGAFVLTTRGDTTVPLYLQETLTFLVLNSGSAVVLAPRATNPPA